MQTFYPQTRKTQHKRKIFDFSLCPCIFSVVFGLILLYNTNYPMASSFRENAWDIFHKNEKNRWGRPLSRPFGLSPGTFFDGMPADTL